MAANVDCEILINEVQKKAIVVEHCRRKLQRQNEKKYGMEGDCFKYH